MTTVSTDALYQQLRTHLLAFVDAGGKTLGDADALGTRLYRIAPPSNAAYPYGVLSLKSPQLPDGTAQVKYAAQLELLLFHRPRAQQAAAEALGDRAVAALHGYRDATSGLAYCLDPIAQSLPPFASPADGDVVQIRVTATLQAWPLFLTSLT